MLRREEAENATELTTEGAEMDVGISAVGRRIENDALGVQGTQIRRYIRSFDDACVALFLLRLLR